MYIFICICTYMYISTFVVDIIDMQLSEYYPTLRALSTKIQRKPPVCKAAYLCVLTLRLLTMLSPLESMGEES